MSSKSVFQDWVHELSFMQQSVLMTAVRGPDGVAKYHPSKNIVRWYRRCTLKFAFDHVVIGNPCDPGGGSFTGPSVKSHGGSDWEFLMRPVIRDYLRSVDELPHHYQLHMMHAAQIVGYKHSTARIAIWWLSFYARLVNDMHLHTESEDEMDRRLGDCAEGWAERADPAVETNN